MSDKTKNFEEGSRLWMMSSKTQPGNCQVLEAQRPVGRHQKNSPGCEARKEDRKGREEERREGRRERRRETSESTISSLAKAKNAEGRIIIHHDHLNTGIRREALRRNCKNVEKRCLKRKRYSTLVVLKGPWDSSKGSIRSKLLWY